MIELLFKDIISTVDAHFYGITIYKSIVLFQVPSKVQIKDVLFRNVYGTSRSEIAVNLKCSKSNPCMNVAMQNINLRYNQRRGKEVMRCLNVKGHSFGPLNPQSCL